MIDNIAEYYIADLEMGYPFNVKCFCEELRMNEEDISKVYIRIKELLMKKKIVDLQEDFNETQFEMD